MKFTLKRDKWVSLTAFLGLFKEDKNLPSLQSQYEGLNVSVNFNCTLRLSGNSERPA